MADKDTGLIGGDTGNIKQTESNRVLTYAAVSDMIDVNNTVLCFRGEINTTVSSVSLTKVSGNALSGKNVNGFIICSFMTDDSIGGGTLTGTITALQNNHNYLTGVIFADYTDQTQAVFAAVQVSAANNYSKIYVVCKGNEAIEHVFADGSYIWLELHLTYY